MIGFNSLYSFLLLRMKWLINLRRDGKAAWTAFFILLFLSGNLSRQHHYLQKNAAHVSLAALLISMPQSDWNNSYSEIESLLHVTHSWRSHALLLSSAGFHSDAITSYEKAVANQPADVLAAYLWGMSEVQLANDSSAIEVWQFVDAEQIINALSHKAETAVNADDSEQAEKWANYLVELGPNNFKAQYWAGRGYRSAGLYLHALDAFDRAVHLGTRDTRLLLNAYKQKGDIHMLLAEWSEAVTAFQAALSLAPNNASLRANLGVALTRAGQFENAEEELLAAIATNPEVVRTYLRLALLYRQRSDFEAAIYWYQKAYEIDPTSSSALRELGVIAFRQQRDLVAARDYLEQAVAVEPERVVNWTWLARIYDALLLADEMETAYRQAIENSTSVDSRVDLLVEMAEALMEHNRYERSLTVWQEALEIQPANAHAQQMVIRIQTDNLENAADD
jgi:tetratricopeptide (TPR) repeat protein